MAASSDKRGMKASTKIAGLAVFILVAIAVYSAAWYYLAEQLRTRVETLIAGLEAEDIVASCDNFEVRGYPFRLGVFCDGISAETAGDAPAIVTTASFRSAAQIYRPGHIVSELDGPVRVALADGGTVDAGWDVLRASTVFGTFGLDRASLEGRAVTADIAVPNAPALQLDADTVAFHTRRNGPDLDLALMATGAELEGEALPEAVPDIDLVAEASFTGGADFLTGRDIAVEELRGTSGQLTNASAALADGALIRLSGPFEITEAGLISGSFDVTVDNLDAWTTTLSDLVPAAAPTIQTAGGLLGSMGGSDGSLSVTLQVREGRVSFGIIPLGRIPAI